MAAAWLLLRFPSFLSYLPPIIPFMASFFFFFSFSFIALFFSARRRRSLVLVNWPIIGMLPVVITNFHRIHDYIVDAIPEVGCNFMFKGPWLFAMDFFITADPANVHYIFNTNFANYPKGDDFTEIFDILGGGLFGADGESWKIQRRMAHGYLSDRKYRSFGVATTCEKTKRGLLPLLGHMASSGDEVDLENVFSRLTFDITCFMAFGFDPGCLSITFPDIPFARAIDEFWEAAAFRHAMPKVMWKLLRWMNLGSERKMARANQVIDSCIAQRISLKREERNASRRSLEEDPKKAADVLSFYMDQPFEEVARFFESEDKFLRDTALFLMIAGRDAFSIGLSWLFLLLSKNPSVEEKILNELRDHYARRKGAHRDSPMVVFDEDEVEGMVYLHGAVCEALRLHVPIPYEHKCALKADVLPSGHRVEAGTKILFSVYAMGRLEKIWGKDCKEFKPERWVTEEGKLRHVPAHKYMVFNSGPRSCLGKEVVLMQMKAVAAAVVWNFKVEVVAGQVVEPKTSVMLRMKNGMRVRVRKRAPGGATAV